MENQDRRIRKDAFEGLYSVYEQFSNTLAAAFSSNVKQAVFYAKAKKYASSREYYLADNEVPELVYDNLVKAVRENIVKLHEYTRVRKDVLGVDELHMYDLYVPWWQRLTAVTPMRRQSPLCWRAWLRWERNICPC